MTGFNKFSWLKAVEWFDLTATEHKVLDHVCNKADGSTGAKAYVTDAGVAEEINRSERSVQRATKRLRDLGLIERTQRGIQGVRPSVYRLTIPAKPDTEVTRHPGSNPTLVTRHSDPVVTRHLDEVTRHPCPSNPTLVSGISDPLSDPLKGSDYENHELPDTEVSGVVASLPVGEGPSESEPSEDVSSSTAIGTPESVPHPDTEVSGISDPQPATGGEAMHDRTDPWASTATASPDPFAPSYVPQPAESQIDYGAIADAHFEKLNRKRETFKLGPGQFIGPDTDPLTGGPNWAQGPRQRP